MASTRAREDVWYDPLRQSRHPDARAAREQADWLSWLELGGAAPRTLSDYCWTSDFVLRMFPTKEMADLTDGDLMVVLKQFPPASRRIRKAALASWFKWAYRTRRIPANPVDLLPEIRRKTTATITVFTEAEEAALESLPSPDGPLMTILLEGGLRKAEARHLRAKRCRLDTMELVVREGAKGSKDRVVPMTDKLAKAVADLLLLERIEPEQYMWGQRPGGGKVQRNRPIAETTFARWWRAALNAADVEYRKPHTTRHTFATRWRREGLDLDDIQLLLGHSSIQTTSDLYVHTKMLDVGRKMRALKD